VQVSWRVKLVKYIPEKNKLISTIIAFFGDVITKKLIWMACLTIFTSDFYRT